MNNQYWRLIEPIAGDHTGDVMRWLERQRDWRFQDTQGKHVNLKTLDLTAYSDEARSHLAQYICYLYRSASDRPDLRDAKPEPQQDREFGPQGMAEPAKPRATPELRQDAPEVPKREINDETLAQEVLDFLRQNRREEYTYNQVNDALDIGDFKQVSRVLKRLHERGNEVVCFEVKQGKKRFKVYKFAPERKALDRDYSRANELVGKAIMSYLAAKPYQSANAIYGAMRLYFGYIAEHSVRNALKTLVTNGKITQKPGARNAILHSVFDPKSDPKSSSAKFGG